MQIGGLMPKESFVIGDHFGAEVLMPTEMELDERITEQIDRERISESILKLEIESLKKAVETVENVSGLSGVQGKGAGA